MVHRLLYASDKTIVDFQALDRFQNDGLHETIGDLGMSVTSDGYWMPREDSFLSTDWLVCETVPETGITIC